MISSLSCISLPCFSKNIISLSWHSVCVLLTFFRLFDTMIGSYMICWFYFLMYFSAFLLLVLHISAFTVRCVSSPFPTVADNMLNFNGFSVALVTIFVHWWIMPVMPSLVVFMSFSSCSISVPFCKSSSNSNYDPVRVVYIVDGLLVITFFCCLINLINYSKRQSDYLCKTMVSSLLA